jgi:histidyl-tRNA synthetase
MSSNKPSIPAGTRDFSPAEMVKRNYIFDTIREVFRKYGYLPLETPAMENLDTLLGKYGEEGDKLLFKILNSGDFRQDLSTADFIAAPAGAAASANALSLKICEKGLRYDLTVPFARYVVQHQHEIVFPFRRYQIQPVWRADRPQKGRYREFYQCDVDVIGSNSLLNELELIQIMDEVFNRLAIKVQININNRKILTGIAEFAGAPEKITEITVALDKLEKIGWENVTEELSNKGIKRTVIDEFKKIIQVIDVDNDQKVKFLNSILKDSNTGIKGVEEINKILDYLKKVTIKSEIKFNLTLARGLNYYTGAIFEVKAMDTDIGSVCGGGRYDDLTGIFGLPGTSGVGVSFGADRIFDAMNQLVLFPPETIVSSRILIANFGEKESAFCLSLLAKLRMAGIQAEMYPDAVKLGKQLAYANSRQIAFVALVGENEIKDGIITVKKLSTGEQITFTLDTLLDYMSA